MITTTVPPSCTATPRPGRGEQHLAQVGVVRIGQRDVLRPVGEVVVERVDPALRAIDELVDHHEVTRVGARGCNDPAANGASSARTPSVRHRGDVGAVVDPVRRALVVPAVTGDERDPEAGDGGEHDRRRRARPTRSSTGHLGGVGEERVEPGAPEDPDVGARVSTVPMRRSCPVSGPARASG